MKKYISILASIAAVLALASCEKDQFGTVPGNDTEPHAIISVTVPGLPNDPDCDAFVRIAANNATTDVYYLAELESAKTARGMSDEAYADYVVSNGTKASLSNSDYDGSRGADVLMPKLFGQNVISVVAVGNGGKYLTSASYYGLKWNDVATGTYKFGSSAIYNTLGVRSKDGVVLQQSDDDPTDFRFKNLYKEGNHLQIKLYPNYTAEDEDGVYTFVRVPSQATGLNHASYGAMSIRDAGYRYGDDAYIFEGGYEGGMYADYNVFLYLSVQVSAGNFGFAYDYFIPE